MKKKNKHFDCVEMKRKIQERIYEETRAMDHRQFVEYMRRKIAGSRFAFFLDRPIPAPHERMIQSERPTAEE